MIHHNLVYCKQSTSRKAADHRKYHGRKPRRATIQLIFSQLKSCHWFMTMPPVSPLFSLYAHHSHPLTGTVL